MTVPVVLHLKALAISLKRPDLPDLYNALAEHYWQEIEKKCQKVSQNDASLYYQHDAWDSDFFEVDVIKVEAVVGLDANSISQLLKSFLKKHKTNYILFRLSQSQIKWIQAILHQGAIFLDSTIDLARVVDQPQKKKPKIAIELAQEKDHDQLIAIADSFAFGRFYTDPLFQKGRDVYRSWIKNALLGKAAKEVFVLKDDLGAVQGFVATKYEAINGFKIMEIPLVGKHNQATKKGVSESLLNFTLAHASKQKIDAAVISTQGTNIPAMRSYISAGFKPYNTGVTLRWFKA